MDSPRRVTTKSKLNIIQFLFQAAASNAIGKKVVSKYGVAGKSPLPILAVIKPESEALLGMRVGAMSEDDVMRTLVSFDKFGGCNPDRGVEVFLFLGCHLS